MVSVTQFITHDPSANLSRHVNFYYFSLIISEAQEATTPGREYHYF